MAGERWIFSREEIANSPSRKCGMDAEKELNYRQQTANMIQDMGQKLQVTQLCINTAIVYMHRFYMFHSFTKFPRTSMAPACLFLAAKVEEQPRKLEHVIKVAHICFHRQNHESHGTLDVKSNQYLEQAQELVVNENILLQTLGFEITVDHPHSHIVKTCGLIRASKDMAQTSYFLATNSLHLTTMTLEYKPTIVACVCINLACQWGSFLIPRSNEGHDWWYYVDKSLTKERLDALTQYFLGVLDKAPSKLKKKLMNTKDVVSGGLPPMPTPASTSSLAPPPEKKPRLEPSATVTSAAASKPPAPPSQQPPAKTSAAAPGAEGGMRRVKTESFLAGINSKEDSVQKERERVERERQRLLQAKDHGKQEHHHPPHQHKQQSNIFDQMRAEAKESRPPTTSSGGAKPSSSSGSSSGRPMVDARGHPLPHHHPSKPPQPSSSSRPPHTSSSQQPHRSSHSAMKPPDDRSSHRMHPPQHPAPHNPSSRPHHSSQPLTQQHHHPHHAEQQRGEKARPRLSSSSLAPPPSSTAQVPPQQPRRRRSGSQSQAPEHAHRPVGGASETSKPLPQEIQKLQDEAKKDELKVMLKRLSPHTVGEHLPHQTALPSGGADDGLLSQTTLPGAGPAGDASSPLVASQDGLSPSGLKLKLSLKGLANSRSPVAGPPPLPPNPPQPPLPLVSDGPVKLVLSKDKLSGHYSTSSSEHKRHHKYHKHHKHKHSSESRKRPHSPDRHHHHKVSRHSSSHHQDNNGHPGEENQAEMLSKSLGLLIQQKQSILEQARKSSAPPLPKEAPPTLPPPPPPLPPEEPARYRPPLPPS